MTGRWIGWAVFGVLVAVAAVVAFINRSFLKESYQELMKVTWPTKDEAINSATVTILFIVVFSLGLALIDYVVNMLVIGLVK